MATRKYVQNQIVRFPKIDCKQMCMKLLGGDEDELVAKNIDGTLVFTRRKKKPSLPVVQEFCWYYILWFMDRKNVASFKIPLSKEIRRLTGFSGKTIQRALLQLQLEGSLRRENSRTFIVRKELANRSGGTYLATMSSDVKAPEWTSRQLKLGEHMTKAVQGRTFEQTTEDEEMEMMQASMQEMEAEIRDLKEQLMQASLQNAELRGAHKTYREIYTGAEERITSRTIMTYERGFDKGVDTVADASEDAQPAPNGKPDIKLVPGLGKKKNPPSYDAKH